MKEAEVAVGTIYLYFSSQDDLYLNLLVEQILLSRSRYIKIQACGFDPLRRGASYQRPVSRSPGLQQVENCPYMRVRVRGPARVNFGSSTG
jgi:hypothetical protein